jgi:hypothetical protein
MIGSVMRSPVDHPSPHSTEDTGSPRLAPEEIKMRKISLAGPAGEVQAERWLKGAYS